ncbi:MAG: PAC2 family protein [Stackebrandtia sp.]
MLNPQELYEVEPDVPDVTGSVLLYEFSGFMDSGSAGSLVADHLLTQFDGRVVARFDVDQLVDYRSRRPTMTFASDHWEHYEAPRIEVHLMRDAAGTPFLLLRGPEPDAQWERFIAAVGALVDRWGVRMTLGFHGIPVGAPHTRPLGMTAHATRLELLGDARSSTGRIQVPGNVSALLQLRFGEEGRDAAGLAVHVPHYLSQMTYPAGAIRLLESIQELTGLRIPGESLRDASKEVEESIAAQVRDSDQVAEVVKALERQYDIFEDAEGRQELPVDPDVEMPTAEELGAQFERFLAEQSGDQ